MFCGLGEERTKIRKKKKEKKEINLIAAKSGLVGIKGYRHLKTYNPMKYFLPYLAVFDWNRFLHQTCGAVFGF